jgi:serine/threonine-protein kinase HipA
MTHTLDLYLDGLLAGRLTQGDDGRVLFEYDPDAGPTSLSVSMPRSSLRHGPDAVMPWLDNLLPDNDDVRARWAARFGERRITPFALLKHVGADCAGAVQIMRPGQVPSQDGELVGITVDEIAAQISAVRADAAAWNFAERGGRWSLGGQQGKFALAAGANGEWMLPSGRAASTHIVKVGISGVAHSDVAEFATMRAAALVGLPVAPVEYLKFGDEQALVTTRFDRIPGGDAGARRLHQEDLCQALGLWRTTKYQADGGPSAGSIVAFLRTTLDPRDRHCGVLDFARVQVFNWLVAGTDAHAKNFAVLHVGSRVLLAPFYDLIAAALLWPPREVHFEGRLAMKFGGEYRLRKVDAGRFNQAAAELGVEEDFLIDTARAYRDQLPDALRVALAETPSAVTATLRDRMVDALATRLGQITIP